jgi:hypothetical protein
MSPAIPLSVFAMLLGALAALDWPLFLQIASVVGVGCATMLVSYFEAWSFQEQPARAQEEQDS